MAKRRSRGEGTVYQRPDGLWCAQIKLPNNKRKSRYNKSQKVVRDWLLAQRQAVRESAWTSDDQITFSAYLDRYYEEILAKTARYTTARRYSGLIEQHIKPGIGHIRLAQLMPHDIQAFYSERQKSGQSKRSVQQMHAIIHKALRYAVRYGLVFKNVSDMVDKPKVAKHSPVVWSLEEGQKFVGACRGERNFALYVLAIYTGLRQGELLGLQVEDLDWSTGSLHVNHALQYEKGKGAVLVPPKTDKARRTIEIPEEALLVLHEHVGTRSSGYVFVSTVGTPVRPRDLVTHFKETLTKAGLKEIRFHDLRHTCATIHLLFGTHPKVVQDILGHSTIQLTLDTYSHILPAMHKEAADRFNKLMGTTA